MQAYAHLIDQPRQQPSFLGDKTGLEISFRVYIRVENRVELCLVVIITSSARL